MSAPNSGFLGRWTIATTSNPTTYPVGAAVVVAYNPVDQKYNLTWTDSGNQQRTMHQMTDDGNQLKRTLLGQFPATITLNEGTGGNSLSAVITASGMESDASDVELEDDGLTGTWTTNERPPAEEEPL